MKPSGLKFMCLATCLGAALTLPLFAQQGGGGAGGGGAGGGGGGGRNFDPAAMRQRYMDRIKEQLGASDEDWKTLQPKIEKITTLQRDSRGFGGGFGRNRGGAGGGADNAPAQPLSDVAQKVKDLQTALDNKDTKPEVIKEKLAALRDARTKSAEEIKKARAELTELLTVRQEAVLVENGILE